MLPLTAHYFLFKPSNLSVIVISLTYRYIMPCRAFGDITDNGAKHFYQTISSLNRLARCSSPLMIFSSRFLLPANRIFCFANFPSMCLDSRLYPITIRRNNNPCDMLRMIIVFMCGIACLVKYTPIRRKTQIWYGVSWFLFLQKNSGSVSLSFFYSFFISLFISFVTFLFFLFFLSFLFSFCFNEVFFGYVFVPKFAKKLSKVITKLSKVITN